MNGFTMEDLSGMQGAPVYDNADEKIGRVDEVFYDLQTNQPEWIGIGTGIFGTKRVLVPVEGAQPSSDGLRVAYAKDVVKESPDVDADQIDPETARALYHHYGLASGDGGQPRSGEQGTEQESVTRHEEELVVGTQPVEAGRVRLQKWVETEPVALDVELKRETARVTREQIDNAASPDAIGDDAVEVSLREEQAVVGKRTVAKERVGIEKGVETNTEHVQDEVRKERVEVRDEQP
jgi:uncharacterized protein (TIGR02271 family)